MLIYYLLLVYIVVLSVPFYLRKGNKKRKEKLYLFLAFLALFLVMALRNESVGTDAAPYHNIFDNIAHARIGGPTDVLTVYGRFPIYALLCKVVSLFGDYQLMLAVTAFIILVGVAVFIYNFSDNVAISTYLFITLYYYLASFNISRNFIAIALILLALCFRKARKYVPCVVFFLLAVGIHIITLAAFPIFLINPEKITKEKFRIYMPIAAAYVLAITVGTTWVVNRFVALFPAYADYMKAGKWSIFNKELGKMTILLVIYYVFFILLGTILQNNHIKKVHLTATEQSRLRFLTIVMTVGAIGSIFNISTNLYRVMLIYSIFSICLIPTCFSKLRQYKFYYLFFYLLLLIPFVYFTKLQFGTSHEVVPYIPMWG